MGYKILDAKADIHESVEKLFEFRGRGWMFTDDFADELREDICCIVDEHFEKIER